ncbi:multidrug ABC transporter ATP-binding protein [Falseniella ignava]|uniref:Multidrug ABC transporter ATP-binding protein n=1 Tax=Falseniella ignava TaxID=137730 RepID=A0A2I1K4K8_9LACT|nr:ABC-F family ATP-binding cassette domain-containing protein [Falseniella ignava]PKY90590.1 multidrug ABC transporter ATP-binding protein [Falseniella ignava]
MILLQLNNVARHFGDIPLYDDVNFSIQSQDRIALVGRNGTGKSTLIKQIIGQEPLSGGTITKQRGIKIGYLEQHVALNSDRTIWEEMLSIFDDSIALREEAMQASERLAQLSDQWDSPAYKQALADYDQLQEKMQHRNVYSIESDIRMVLHGFRFYEEDYDRPINSLSGGQQTRLALARTLLMDYDLLILDEPTNHLDMETLNWLEGFLSNYRGALLIVSHDRYFLNRVTRTVVELRHHTSHLYKGNYDFYLKEKALRLSQEMKQYEAQQEEIAKLEDFIARNIVRASTTKRAQSRRKKLEKMTRIEKPLQDDKAPRIQFSAARESGERVIDAEDLAIGYSAEETPVATDLNVELKRQDAVAIVGPNGVGKSTLIKTLIGRIPALAGTISIGTKVDIGYYDQNVNQLNPNLTVLETLWQAHDTVDEWKIRSILGSFLFTGETVEKRVAMLSGGEKARLSLALLASDHDNTLLLDEPTNHLDIDSKEILEEALIDYDGTLLFVSHDRYFINRIATQILEITPTGSQLYLGDYDYYLEKKSEQEAIDAMLESEEEIVTTTPTPTVSNFEENKQLKRELKRLTTLVEETLTRSEEMDQTIESIHQQLVEASEINDQVRLLELHQTLQQVEAEQLKVLDQWEEASLALEAFEAQYPHVQI